MRKAKDYKMICVGAWNLDYVAEGLRRDRGTHTHTENNCKFRLFYDSRLI